MSTEKTINGTGESLPVNGRTSPPHCPPCACENWCVIDHTHRLLTGHHEGCPHSPKALDKALELIAALARGMELWGAEEDGIYPEAWEAYRKAKALQGVLIPPEQEGQMPNLTLEGGTHEH
jgi:hypothetical protein